MIEIDRKPYGEYYAKLCTKNGVVLAITNTFNRKESLMVAIESMKKLFRSDDIKVIDRSDIDKLKRLGNKKRNAKQ